MIIISNLCTHHLHQSLVQIREIIPDKRKKTGNPDQEIKTEQKPKKAGNNYQKQIFS